MRRHGPRSTRPFLLATALALACAAPLAEASAQASTSASSHGGRHQPAVSHVSCTSRRASATSIGAAIAEP